VRRKKKYFEQQPDMPLPISCEVHRILAFSEVDAMGIAWHGNYLRFFEAAHTALMKKIGLRFQVYAKEEIGAPIVQSHVDYYSPLLIDEPFTVRAELYWNDGARFDVAYTVFGNDHRICACGYTVQMFYHLKTHEPYMFPPQVIMEMRERWIKGEFHDKQS